GEILTILSRENFVHYEKNRLEGDYAIKCLNDEKLARESWKKALSYYPPYEKQRKYLEDKLK
ncbi:MAG: hypothetical protein K2Q18_11385, partial [Bdellovibrionales bacterium]|nr:hypothetical protein [Bdellovibrionales bacterium]